MSKLNIDQQTIKELFSNKRADFLIPDYQRPYAWRNRNVKHCGKTNEFGQPDKNRLKIDSEVSTDDDKEEFLTILKNRNCGWLTK